MMMRTVLARGKMSLFFCSELRNEEKESHGNEVRKAVCGGREMLDKRESRMFNV